VTTADGQVLGTTRIVDNGPAATFWNIVLLGDGYRAQELATYHADAQRACEVLFDTHPFDQRRSVINVLRVDVTSTDSGADDPATGSCAGTGATARTYFDATFCSGGLRRLLVVNRDTALAVASDQVPEWSVVMLIVNSTVYGRSGGSVGVFSRAPQAQEIALHELGHLVPFRLADEYDNLAGCGVDVGHDTYSGPEPPEPNVTKESNRASIKWRDLIGSATPVPAMTNPDCTQCDRRPSPVPEGTVSAFEGAKYFHCGLFRPEYRCKMFELGRPFCAVCRRRILQVLPTKVPLVRELSAAVAASRVDAALLTPKFTGPTGTGAWVWHQSPAGGSVRAPGTTVTLQTRTGPIP
jgi:hypothetical protein